jgi:hypothetical protein
MSAGTLMVTTATTTPLSYEALADRLGITIATAKRTVHRHRWKRTRDNHGKTVVYVPDEYFARRDENFEAAQRTRQRASDGHDPGHVSGVADGHVSGHISGDVILSRLAELQRELAEMARKLGAADNRVAAAEAMAAELRQDRDRWAAQAEAAQQQAQEALRQLAERRPGLLARLFRRAG